mgnify:CR=1 FL=1
MWGGWVVVGVTALMIFFYLFGPRFLVDLENKSLDFRFLARGEIQPSNDIVIIAIDERSISEFGRWPWSRDLMATLVNKLNSSGVRVIGIDIIYSEPEITDRMKTIATLRTEVESIQSDAYMKTAFLDILDEKQSEASADAKFVRAIGEAGNVVMAVAPVIRRGSSQDGLNFISRLKLSDTKFSTSFNVGKYVFNLVKNSSLDTVFDPIEVEDILPPLPELLEQAIGLGHVYALQDRDGIIRYGILTVRYKDDYFPSFPLVVAQTFLGIPWDRMVLRLAESVSLGDITVPTDERGRMLLHHYGQSSTFTHYSAAAVLSDELPPGTLEDKIVLVGTTAMGAYDLRSNPFDPNVSGAEINATVVENIIHGQMLNRNERTKTFDVLAIIIGGLFTGLIILNLRGLHGTGAVVVLLLGYVFFVQYLFATHGVWISLVAPLTTILFCYVALTVLSYMTEERRAREIRSMFSSFVNPRIVEELIQNPDAARLGGFRRDVTLLFADIRGFTSFSEKHRDDPENVVIQLNEYLQAMTEEVFRFDGTLDKFVGDAVMVFWGAPIKQPNHAELGLKCALAMGKRLKILNERWEREGREIFTIGIGLHSGSAVVGNMGSKGLKMDYTAIGDTVNLAARLEGATKEYNTCVILSEVTNFCMGEGFITRELDYISLKGKENPVRVFDLMGEAKDASMLQVKLREAFQSVLKAYRNKDWDEAETQLNICLSLNESDGPALTFRDRIQLLRETPPQENWDGVWRMAKK